jgi:hypothetical protein
MQTQGVSGPRNSETAGPTGAWLVGPARFRARAVTRGSQVCKPYQRLGRGIEKFPLFTSVRARADPVPTRRVRTTG